MKTDVLVVDDQRAFAESLQVVLDVQPDLRCVGIAATGDEAVELARAVQPDVVLMDVVLSGADGIDVMAQIIDDNPECRVIVLTQRPDAPMLARAASAGAMAFLLKETSLDDILDAVRQPRRRRVEVDAAALCSILGPKAEQSDFGDLTPRELEVLGLLATGLQPKQIALRLGVKLPTCRSYVKSLLQKLGAHSALEAVARAYQHGLVRAPEAGSQRAPVLSVEVPRRPRATRSHDGRR